MTYSERVREKYSGKRMSKPEREDIEDFCDWLDEVDEIVKDETGYSLLSLPDQCYRDWFDDNSAPEDAAEFFVNDWKKNGDISK